MRVKKWREDAQPEWPEAASGTQDIPLTKGSTQAFPESGEVRSAEETGAGRSGLREAGAKPGFVVYYTNYSLMINSDISGIEKISD